MDGPSDVWTSHALAAMDRAISEAGRATEHGDVPVGAALFDSATGAIVATAHNRREVDADPTAHAEVLALRAAAAQRGGWRMTGLSMAVTLEPCVMCAGALLNARIDGVVFGSFDLKAGAMGSLYHVGADPRLNHAIPTVGGLDDLRCAALLTEFFSERRAEATDRFSS